MPDAAVRARACRARSTSLVYRRRPLRRPTRVGAKDGARPAILIEGDGEDGYAERGGCRGARSRPRARATARAEPGRLLHARREHADDAPAQYVSAYRGRRADPFERKYFAYLFRWARLLDRREWPKRWDGRSFGSLTQEERTPLIGPLRGFREICCAHPAASRRCRSTASTWHGGSSRTVPGRSKGIERASATTPRSTWTRGSSTWRSCHRSRSSSCFATPVTPISRSGHSTGSGASLATRAYDVARGLQSREDRLDWFIDRQRDRMRW